MSEYKNCKLCGRVFMKVRDDICPECKKTDDENFQLVRSFLKEFPGTNIHVVVEYTGVSEKRIMRYLREGRIEIIDSEQNFLTCLKCDKPITKGKYCHDCYNRFCDDVAKIYSKPKAEEVITDGKMRFLNRD